MTKFLLALLLSFCYFAPYAHATYSIVACDPQTRECGVAVQTNNLAVGASVPYAQAGVGALASQFETNPNYGPRGLALMAGGKSPEETLQQLLREDGNFDGKGIEARQVGIVSLEGKTAVYTGEEAASSVWAGARNGNGYSIQGNGLAGAGVVDAMEKAFNKSSGPLADRLLAALKAGDTAGGQKTGRQSAALLVRTLDGFPLDIDLRVDSASDPVGELQKLYAMQFARQQVVQANIAARKDNLDQARFLMMAAVARASAWPRIWIQAARVAENIEERQLALQYITVAFAQNPAWTESEIGSGTYAELGSSPLFHRWITPAQEQRALASLQSLQDTKKVLANNRMQVARILLEAGHSREALIVLNDTPDRAAESADLKLLRAEAYAANGDYKSAIQQCHEASTKSPDNLRIRLRMEELNRESINSPQK
jgi:uncharacterized Ntn-hydrolase superfamily protein